MNYGHWKTLKEVDIKDYIGFVYVIEFSNGTKYIGAKKIWKIIKAAPSTFKKKKDFSESDWKTYTSSSKEVNENIINGITPSNYIIVGFYKTWGSTLYAEALMQLQNNVLGDDTWLNKHVEGHFTRSCLDDNIQIDINNWKEYEAFNLEPVYKPRSVLLYDILTASEIEVDNIYSFCSEHGTNPSTMDRLLSGDIDDIGGRYKLSLENQRRVIAFVFDGVGYVDKKSLLIAHNIDTKQFNTLVKEDKITKLEVEDRASFKKRIENEKQNW